MKGEEGHSAIISITLASKLVLVFFVDDKMFAFDLQHLLTLTRSTLPKFSGHNWPVAMTYMALMNIFIALCYVPCAASSTCASGNSGLGLIQKSPLIKKIEQDHDPQQWKKGVSIGQ